MNFWKCTVCGWLHEGDNPPERCPRCGAPAEKFELVDMSEFDLDDDSAVPAVKELTEADKKRIQAALYRISYGLFIVGSKDGDKINAQTCNTVFQITSTPMRIVVGVNKNNLTNEYIKKSGVFTVSILGLEDGQMVGQFGYRSGREVNKFENVKYSIGVTGAPVIDQCIAYLECRVDPELSIDVGTHTMFIGEVIEGNVKNESEPMTYAFYRQLKNKPSNAPKVKQWLCKVCGYIHTGDEPPETCPVCGAPSSEFELVQ